MDRIIIEDLALRCIVGVNPEERISRRDVVITVTLEVDLLAAGRSDDIADTVDYSRVQSRIMDTVRDSEYRLIEALAHDVARACLREPGVRKAGIRLEKPGALPDARTVAVEIERSSAHFG